MSNYPLDYAFGAALLTLLAISAAVWIGQAWVYHRRLRRIRKNAIPAPWDGAIAGRTGRYYVQRWDRYDKWDAAVRGRIVGTPRIRR